MDNKTATGKFIIFSIADYLLALPVYAVLKVINYPLTNTDSLKVAGLVRIGKHTLKLLDLNQKLTTIHASQSHRNSPFLLIVQVQGELGAIPVDEPPNLAEISRDSIQSLPTSAHQAGLLDIVSHTAVLSDAENTFTIFILDLNQVMNITHTNIPPRLIAVEQ